VEGRNWEREVMSEMSQDAGREARKGWMEERALEQAKGEGKEREYGYSWRLATRAGDRPRHQC